MGWRLLDSRWDNLDIPLPWYGASMFLLLVVAMPWPTRERVKAGWAGLLAFWTKHRWELVAFGLVFGLAIFMRIYKFGHFPPGGGLGFEESETGGDAYSTIVYGTRPERVQFVLTNYTAVFGFALFGYNITALRLPFLIIGILSVVPFYLLLRLMVSAPVALFTTALFAVSRWLAFTSRIADEMFWGVGPVILAALLLVVVLRTGNPLALIGLALATGALVYEYPSYRHVAFLVVGALIGAVALSLGRDLVLRRKTVVDVVAGAGRRWWLVPVFAIALAMAVSPMVISSLHGDPTFFENLRRNTAVQEQTGPFGLLPEGWPTRVKWVAEVLLPLGPHDYPDFPQLNLPGQRMLDPVTASLALIAMAWALVTFYKPYRLFFALWLLIGLFVGAVIPSEFRVAKLTGLLPALFVLIAFLVEDATRIIPRRVPSLASHIVLIPLVVWAFVVNFDVFVRQADDPRARQAFDLPFVNMCEFATDLGPDTYVYIWSDTNPMDSLFKRGDFEWLCRDMRGESLNSMAEVWPLEPRPYQNVAFIYLNVKDPEPDPIRHLAQGYPTVTGPAKVWSPLGSYTLRAFVLPEADIARQQGLYGAYYADGMSPGSPVTRRLDSAPMFVGGQEIEWPAGSTRVQWEGLVLTKLAGETALVPEVQAPLEIRVDGQLVYQSDGAAAKVSPINLGAGWHPLQIDLGRTGEGRAPRLTWVTQDGVGGVPVEGSDLFAVSPVEGWAHVRSVKIGEKTASWQRVDPYPAFGWSEVWLPDWLSENDGSPRPITAPLLREEWRTDWHVPAAGTYGLKLNARSGTAVLLVDGDLAASLTSERGQVVTQEQGVLLQAGEHRLELIFESHGAESVGVALEIEDAGGGVGSFTPF